MTFKGDGGTITPIACAMLSEPTRALRMGYDFARGAANVEEPVLLAVVADASAIRPRRRPASTPSRSSACSPTI